MLKAADVNDALRDYHARLIERITRRRGVEGQVDLWKTDALVQLLNDEFQRLSLTIEELEDK